MPTLPVLSPFSFMRWRTATRADNQPVVEQVPEQAVASSGAGAPSKMRREQQRNTRSSMGSQLARRQAKSQHQLVADRSDDRDAAMEISSLATDDEEDCVVDEAADFRVADFDSYGMVTEEGAQGDEELFENADANLGEDDDDDIVVSLDDVGDADLESGDADEAEYADGFEMVECATGIGGGDSVPMVVEEARHHPSETHSEAQSLSQHLPQVSALPPHSSSSSTPVSSSSSPSSPSSSSSSGFTPPRLGLPLPLRISHGAERRQQPTASYNLRLHQRAHHRQQRRLQQHPLKSHQQNQHYVAHAAAAAAAARSVPGTIPMPAAASSSAMVSRRGMRLRNAAVNKLVGMRSGQILPSAKVHILDLDDDCLMRIMHFVLSPVRVTSSDRIVERSYLAALPVASVSRRFRRVFHESLRDLELWQSAKLPSYSLARVAQAAGSDLKRIVLRNCSQLQPAALDAIAENCTTLRTIDISNVEAVDDSVLLNIIEKRGQTLRSILARGCAKLTDASLVALGRHGVALDALDISSLPLITDAGICSLLDARGPNIVSLVCSACPLLTDATFWSMGENCRNLEVLCARSLSQLTNEGVEALCSGVGDRLEVLDILDCESVTVKPFLESVGTHCPRLSSRFMDGEGRTLKQVIISSLPGFIFHVTGRDAYNGRSAVYFLLVDPGTSNSFRVSVGTEHMNLVDFGQILCSCFGDRPSDGVRDILLSEYGLDLDDQAPN